MLGEVMRGFEREEMVGWKIGLNAHFGLDISPNDDTRQLETGLVVCRCVMLCPSLGGTGNSFAGRLFYFLTGIYLVLIFCHAVDVWAGGDKLSLTAPI